MSRRLLLFSALLAAAGPGAADDGNMAWLIAEAAQSPRMRAAEFGVRAAGGTLTEARGQFDPVHTFDATLDVGRGELLPVVLRQQQQSRFLLEQLDDNFTRSADRLQADLDANAGPVVIDCEGNIIVINGREICESPEAAAQREALAALIGALIDAAPDEETLLALQRIRDQSMGDNRAFVEETIAQLRQVAESSRASRERLGDIPRVERVITATVDIGYLWPLRSGASLRPQLLLEGVDDSFENKPRSSRFGGTGLDRVFRSAVGMTYTRPFGRGGGESVTAAEDEAALRLEATLAQARSTQQSVYRDALLAWLQLLAAQAREALAEQRVQRLDGVGALVDALIQADQLAAAERAVPSAQAAQARANAAIARRLRLATARELGSVLGVDFDSVLARPSGPSALAVLARLPTCGGTPADWIAHAAAGRPDLHAAHWRQRAAERLVDAARDLLQPRFDLSVTLAWSGRDERNDVLAGYGNALFDEMAGPSILMSLAWDMAIRNDAASGQLQQALALAEQATIAHDDAQLASARSLRALAAQLATGRELLALRASAVGHYRQAHADLTELLSRGEQDLAALVSSEEQLDAAEAALIDVELAQAQRLLQLRFSLGELRPPAGEASVHWLATRCPSTGDPPPVDTASADAPAAADLRLAASRPPGVRSPGLPPRRPATAEGSRRSTRATCVGSPGRATATSSC